MGARLFRTFFRENSLDEIKHDADRGDQNPVNTVMSKIVRFSVAPKEIDLGGDVYQHSGTNKHS